MTLYNTFQDYKYMFENDHDDFQYVCNNTLENITEVCVYKIKQKRLKTSLFPAFPYQTNYNHFIWQHSGPECTETSQHCFNDLQGCYMWCLYLGLCQL